MQLFKRKPKALTSDEFRPVTAIAALGGKLRSLYDRLHGRSSDELHNCSGIRLELEGAVLYQHGDPVALVAVRLGDRVCGFVSLPASDKWFRSLDLETFGKSEAEIATEKRRKEYETATPEEKHAAQEGMYKALGLQVTTPHTLGGGAPEHLRRDRRNHPGIKVL